MQNKKCIDYGKVNFKNRVCIACKKEINKRFQACVKKTYRKELHKTLDSFDSKFVKDMESKIIEKSIIDKQQKAIVELNTLLQNSRITIEQLEKRTAILAMQNFNLKKQIEIDLNVSILKSKLALNT